MIDTRAMGDPRLQSLFGISDARPADPDLRPVVRLPGRGPSGLLIAAAAVLAALALFYILESRRRGAAQPAVAERAADRTQGLAEPPPLFIPPLPAPSAQPLIVMPTPGAAVAVPRYPTTPPVPRQIVQQPAYMPAPPAEPVFAPPAYPPPMSNAPAVVDSGTPPLPPGIFEGASQAQSSAGQASGSQTQSRMQAVPLANPSGTVAQGTIIQAVLETAFDSTSPGFARALVSRDIHSFDGSRVLITRGSRLIGEYKSEIARGQKRAAIVWTRLIRPDGLTIRLDSPAVDPLGRGGVPASVNTHFLARLGDALLHTTLDLGRTIAGRASPVVIALPGQVAAAATPAPGHDRFVPTLKIPPGKSISVFVAHDLDFGSAGAP